MDISSGLLEEDHVKSLKRMHVVPNYHFHGVVPVHHSRVEHIDHASITHKILLPSQIVATRFILSVSTPMTRASKMDATQIFMPSQQFLCAAIARRVYLKDSAQNVICGVNQGPNHDKVYRIRRKP